MKKRSLAFMVSIAMAATLMGCGGDDSASGGSAEEPKEVTLTIGSNADQPTSLDRFVNVGYGCDDLDYLIFDPLVNSDHQGTYTPGMGGIGRLLDLYFHPAGWS